MELEKRKYSSKVTNFMDDLKDKTIKELKSMIPDPEKILKAADEWGLGPKSKDLIKRALKVESLGAMAFSEFETTPIIDRSGEGAIVYDVDGKSYIDLMAGFSVNNVGYKRQEILQAIVKQYEKLPQYAEMFSEERIKLGEKLCSITPGGFDKKVFYSLTGSEANEIAIKLVRIYTGKPYIITQYGDYHGRTIGTVPFTHSFSTWFQQYPVPSLDIGVARIPFPYGYRCPCGNFEEEDCADECLHYVDYMLSSSYYGLCDSSKGLCNISAFLIEPFQSAAGYYIPPKNWLPSLYKLAKEHGILFVVDEIQAGMGRTGKWWAIQHYPEIEPDITIIGKALGGGLPFQATIGRKEIMDSWGPGAHSSTFAGYFVGVAAALATLQFIEQNGIIEKTRVNGEYFIKLLNELKGKHPMIGEVQGKGLYIGMEFIKDRKKTPATKETTWLTMKLLQMGVLVKKAGYYRNRFAISPPLTIEKEEIEKVVQIFDKALKETEENFNIKY